MVTEHQEDKLYFEYSATLRIFGEIVDLELISKKLEIQPTKTITKGFKRSESSKPSLYDMWFLESSKYISKEESLSLHLDYLWGEIREKVDSIKEYKNTLNVDIFCGYRSNCDNAGFEIDHNSLKIFEALEVPVSVSVIIA